MNAITPAKLIPPDHSTAARGTLPTEQTKLSTAISGPTITFSIAVTSGGASLTNRPLKKSSPSRPMKPASRKPIVISFQSICQSPRKLCGDVRPGVDATLSRSPPAQPPRRPRGAGGRRRPRCACSPRLLLEARRDEQPQRHRHQHDHHDAADVLGQRELPADQDPEDQAQLPDQVGGGELEGERGRRRGPLLEQRLGDRDRRVGARRGRGAEPRGLGDAAAGRCPTARPRSARAGPRPGRSRRSRSRGPAPTRPRRPSGRTA